jgi:hypothetical protein
MMYLIYIIDQIHHLMNELKKLIFAYNGDLREYIPFIINSSTTNYVSKNGQEKPYVPHAKAPIQKWVQLTHKNVQYRRSNVVKGDTSNCHYKRHH